MNEQVTEYIDKLNQDWQVEVCKRLREAVHQAVPDVTERLQYGKPHFLKNGKYAAVLGPAKGWVSFTIFNAADLDVPDGLFEPSDAPERKTVKIKSGQAVDYDLLRRLVGQAAGAL
jgi:hypothetical protein